MVVRRSNRYVSIQFIRFDPKGDKTVLSVNGQKLAKASGYQVKRNVWSAYLCGLLAGKEAQKTGIKEFILDTGMYTASKGNIVFAALKGALDSGLSTKYQEEMVPNDKLDNPPDKKAFEDAKSKITG
jgi:large subunit ribosomal protein L18